MRDIRLRGWSNRRAGETHASDDCPHRHCHTWLDQLLKHDAAGDAFQFNIGFVGLDDGEHISLLDCIARLFQPFDQAGFLHVKTQIGHYNVGWHLVDPLF
jgi:hypothetical protein